MSEVAAEPSETSELTRPVVRRWVFRAAWVGWVVGLTLLVTPFIPASQQEVGPGVVALSAGPSLEGGTRLSFPPLGTVRARTHRSPVRLTAELRELDVQPLISSGGRLDAETIEAEVRDDLPAAVLGALVHMLVAAAIIGALAAAVLPHRRVLSVLAGALVGATTMALVLLSSVPGYDVTGFEEPTYDGSLALGGPLLRAVTSGDSSGLDARVDVLARRLADLYSASTTSQIAASAGDVSILHVSDIHLNPIGLNLARDLATAFDVDAIVDTGDTTSFGLPVEEPFSELFDEFPVPYYFVGGNHDSPANRRLISAAAGVTSINRRVVEVKGVSILGFDDPVVTTTRTVPAQERRETMRDAGPELEELVAQNTPDVVAIHNPAMASAVAGEVPLVIAGHLHRTLLTAQDGTLVSVVGSSGATGLGSLTVNSELPYVAQVLRFSDSELVAIDTVELTGVRGDFVVKRALVGDAAREVEPDTAIDEDPEEPTLEDLDDAETDTAENEGGENEGGDSEGGESDRDATTTTVP
ncbi:MAG: metallophosphoesterase [Microthrixaceae bacterium]